MSFKSSLKLDSDIWESAKRKAAGGRAMVSTARNIRNISRQKMVFGKPSGNIYERETGSGFTRLHRASRRGEFPAVFTGNLANRAIKFRRTSGTSAETYIDTEQAPYAKKLIKMQRRMFPDRREMEQEMNREMEKEFSKLV